MTEPVVPYCDRTDCASRQLMVTSSFNRKACHNGSKFVQNVQVLQCSLCSDVNEIVASERKT